MTVRLLLVDDHELMRQGLRAILEHEKDIEIVGEADNGRMAVQLARTLSPDKPFLRPESFSSGPRRS